jgi:hypothetical protein
MIYKLFKKYIDREVDKRVTDNAEMKFLESIGNLKISYGDLIIVEYPDKSSDGFIHKLEVAIKNLMMAYGFFVEVMVVTNGLKLSASSKSNTGLAYVVDNDKDFLKWIWARLYYLHGESPDSDYMHKLLDIADQVGFENDVKEFISNYFDKVGY